MPRCSLSPAFRKGTYPLRSTARSLGKVSSQVHRRRDAVWEKDLLRCTADATRFLEKGPSQVHRRRNADLGKRTLLDAPRTPWSGICFLKTTFSDAPRTRRGFWKRDLLRCTAGATRFLEKGPSQMHRRRDAVW